MTVDITDYVKHDLSDEKKQEAFDRTVQEFGGVELALDNDDFRDEFDKQLRISVATQIIEELAEDGLVKIVGVDNGEYGFASA